jgi:hypothetical protein
MLESTSPFAELRPIFRRLDDAFGPHWRYVLASLYSLCSHSARPPKCIQLYQYTKYEIDVIDGLCRFIILFLKGRMQRA